MSEFIFDEIYGSEAKRKKIMENKNFIYYRQMMKIKHNHIKNPSLYSQLYELPIYQQSPKPVKSQQLYAPDIFSTLNQNNYVVQKINQHAFKIVKRKQKSNVSKPKPNNFFNMTIQRGLSLNSGRKLTARTIDEDARKLRSFLQSSEQKSPSKSRSGIKNHSMELQSNRTFRTYSKGKNAEYDTSAFSNFQQSTIDYRKH